MAYRNVRTLSDADLGSRLRAYAKLERPTSQELLRYADLQDEQRRRNEKAQKR